VTPSGGANFHRSSNGTVNPPSFPYTITNAGTSEIQYRVSTNQNWLTISPTYGTLQGGRSVRIDLSVNNNARDLSPGTYTATVTFRNTTTGCEENRTVTLTVEGRNNTGTGRTHNPYWGARVRVTLNDRNRPPIENHNLVAYSDGKIYLHNPGGCSNNCQYESITVDSATGSVTVHPEKAISIGEVSSIEVVNPGGFSVRTYGGVNKYIVKFSNENEYKSRAVELGNVRDADNTRCLLTEYSWNQLGYGVAYDGSTWYWWISDYSSESCQFVPQSGNPQSRNIQELIAIPVAEVYPAGVNNNDIYNDVRQAIRNVGGRFRIPPHILYGIAWQESKWRQTPESAGYGGYDTRLTLISYDGGIGIMQITAGTVYNRGIFRDETTNLSNKLTHIYKLAKFPEYNIEAGARVLVEKAKDAERDNIKIGFGTTFRPSGCVLEHWYYPVWRYNGWTYELKEFMCGEAAVDAPWRCPRSGNNMWLYPERIWAHIERRWNCTPALPDWLDIPLGLGYPPTTDFPSDSSGSANDDCINGPDWRCTEERPRRSKPTPFPAHVDIDFNGTIDFVVEIPSGSSDRCSSCGECNQVYVVCSSSDHCDPSSNSCYHICGKVYRYGYTRFSPSIVRLYSVSESGGRIDSGVYSGEISYPPGGAIGEFDIAIPAIHMRCQQQQCKKVFRLEFWMDNPQEAPQPFFAVDLRVWLRGSGNFLGTRTISGHLILEQYQGSPPQGVEFVLRDPDTGEIVATHSDYFGLEGEFSIPAPAGRFELSVKVSHWLRRAVLVDTTLGDVEGLVLSLINGDANDDNVVDGEDLAMVVQNYGSSCWDDCPEGGLPGDLNGDLVVDDNDLLIVLFNFGQQGD
jgi:hypothetical protein